MLPIRPHAKKIMRGLRGNLAAAARENRLFRRREEYDSRVIEVGLGIALQP